MCLWRKPIALFVSVALILLDSTSYAGPVQTLNISIPNEFGTIEESFVGPSDKTIIYIQDAHDSLDAQENIAKIIHYLVKNRKVRTVLEEGDEGPVETDKFFGFIENSEIKKKISYFLMDRLRLGGAEYAHINRTKDFKLIGIDSNFLHLKNIKAYQEAAKSQSQTRQDLMALHKEIQNLADRYFPREMKEWMRLKKKFNRQELSFIHY